MQIVNIQSRLFSIYTGLNSTFQKCFIVALSRRVSLLSRQRYNRFTGGPLYLQLFSIKIVIHCIWAFNGVLSKVRFRANVYKDSNSYLDNDESKTAIRQHPLVANCDSDLQRMFVVRKHEFHSKSVFELQSLTRKRNFDEAQS